MKFLALPVKKGDSFYYERDDLSLLLDGGIDEKHLPKLLSLNSISSVNILICTHSDADHSSGIIGFLDDPMLSTDELWLPLDWLNAVEKLIASAGKVETTLTTDIADIENLTETFSDYEDGPDDNSIIEGSEETIDVFAEAELAQSKLNELIEELRKRRSIFRKQNRTCCPIHTVADTLKENALNICRVFSLALDTSKNRQKKIILRFFEHAKNPQPIGGYNNFIRCISAAEAKPKKSSSSLARILQFTSANRRSLVFYAPESKPDPAILFSSDSNLNCFHVTEHPSHVIITAPHHGSRDIQNEYAAKKITAHFKSSTKRIWVRSDDINGVRPADWYIKIPDAKYCTRCNTGQINSNIALDPTMTDPQSLKCECR